MTNVRILHTGDWHLGFRLGRHSRRGDTTEALKSLIDHAERTTPHLIVHAGDVFHEERPPQSAIEDAVGALKALAEYAPVVITAGNHDGPRLLESLDRLAQEGRPQRITIATRPRSIVVRLNNRGDGPTSAVIAAVPWLSRGDGATAWAETGRPMNDRERPSHAAWAAGVIRRTIDDAHRAAAAEAGADGAPVPPVIALIHTHLAGAVASKAEREIAVSAEYAVDPREIPETAYCACGHIHDRQEIGGTGAVYCGSLIQMTFGEKAQRKTAELVELRENTPSDTPSRGRAWRLAGSRQLELDAERALVEHDGTWAELAAAARGGGLTKAILKATVHSEDRLHDLATAVRDLQPDIVIHELRNPVANPTRIENPEIDFEEQPEPLLDELYAEWRRDRQSTEREDDDGAVDLFRTALHAVREPSDDPFGIKKLEDRFETIAARLKMKTTATPETTPALDEQAGTRSRTPGDGPMPDTHLEDAHGPTSPSDRSPAV